LCSGVVRDQIDAFARRVAEQLRSEPESVMAWESIPLSLYGDCLPPPIRSSWVFILRGGTASGAERHPNSHQRMMSYRGTGDLQTGGPRQWQSHRLCSEEHATLDARWVSVPPNIWHQAVVCGGDWTVVSFHTAAAHELIEERPVAPDALETRQRTYVPGEGPQQSPDLRIREATEADLPAIVEIYNQSIPAGWSTADTRPITTSERIEWFRKFDPARRPIWVAELDSRVVATAYLSSFYGGRAAYDATAEISVYVATEFHRRGLGRRLKEFVIGQCPRLGVTTLLSMHFDHNQATRRINESLEFEQLGHLTEIAVVQGQKRGLVIWALRISPQDTA
jgi:phosphinothricin acetyltransferase